MESQSDQTSPQTADAESAMRQNLGLNGSASSSANDPLKMARQAIRSQVTARDYAEQQLSKAQGAIQDLRNRLRHVHHERESAINAAQSAMAARDTAERSTRAAESALATERANRARVEGTLRDAQATILDLREKLAAANQTIKSTQAELAAERSAISSSEDGAVVAVPKVVAPTVRQGVLPVVKRPVGRPRRVTVGERVQTVITPPEKPLAIRDDAVLPNVDAAVPNIRRPVGRPRKIVVAEAIQTMVTTAKKVQVVGKAVTARTAKPKRKVTNRGADDEEPVQWWVKGWNGR
jgi:hypothetical protein